MKDGKKNKIIFGSAVILFGVFFILLFIDQYPDMVRSNIVRDAQTSRKGMLVATRDTIPAGFVRDETYYGYGGNEGGGGFINTTTGDISYTDAYKDALHGRFRLTASTNALGLPSEPRNSLTSRMEYRMEGLCDENLVFSIQDFTYNTTPGSLIHYTVNTPVRNQYEYWKLLWGEGNDFVAINAEVPEGTFTPQQIVDKLRTLRRSNGFTIEPNEVGTTSPIFEPHLISSNEICNK